VARRPHNIEDIQIVISAAAAAKEEEETPETPLEVFTYSKH